MPGTAVPGHDGEVLPWVLYNFKDTARTRSIPRRQDELATLTPGERDHAKTLSLRWGKVQEGLAQKALALEFIACLGWGLVRDFWKIGRTWSKGVGVHTMGTGEQPPSHLPISAAPQDRADLSEDRHLAFLVGGVSLTPEYTTLLTLQKPAMSPLVTVPARAGTGH